MDDLLQIQNLKQYFPVKTGFLKSTPLKAVDDVSFCVKKGETLGLVGESGCGKTTVGRSILHLYTPTDGQVFFHGKPIDLKSYRRKTAMVFQDPYSSLDPRMTVMDMIAEPLDIHRLYDNRKHRQEKVLALMEKVGLRPDHALRYAHEFSGGQRQRIGIARDLKSVV